MLWNHLLQTYDLFALSFASTALRLNTPKYLVESKEPFTKPTQYSLIYSVDVMVGKSQ